MTMDRLQAMSAFVRVVDTGSFSEAARQIGVGQPAISKTIAQMEDRLQVRLLIRSTHGLAPTDAGLRFYERAKAAIREADEAELEARGAGAGLSGRLRLCAATTFASLMILPRLPEFLATHPDLEVDIILDDRMIDLVSEGIDIALRMGDLADSSAVARRIATGRRSVVASPAYLDRHGVPRTPSELVAHQAIVHPQLGNSWKFAKAGTELTVQLSGRVRFTAAEGIRAAAKAGMGLAVASEWMFWPELQRGEVVRLLDDWHLPEIDLWAVFPTGRLATAKARAFADFAETVMR
jgi:DNA-binding transcriptional LysR family regulator